MTMGHYSCKQLYLAFASSALASCNILLVARCLLYHMYLTLYSSTLAHTFYAWLNCQIRGTQHGVIAA
jgi:hypothetical protein